jgi:hypothetical protein
MNSALRGEGDIFIRQSLEYRNTSRGLSMLLGYPLVFRNIETFVLIYESTLKSFCDLQLRRVWVNGESGFLFTVCNLN